MWPLRPQRDRRDLPERIGPIVARPNAGSRSRKASLHHVQVEFLRLEKAVGLIGQGVELLRPAAKRSLRLTLTGGELVAMSFEAVEEPQRVNPRRAPVAGASRIRNGHGIQGQPSLATPRSALIRNTHT